MPLGIWRAYIAVVAGVTVSGCDVVFRLDKLRHDAAIDAKLFEDAPGLVQRSYATMANEDDALQDPDGSMRVEHPWISLYTDAHFGALRFVVTDVARNALIMDAYLEVNVDSTGEDSPNLVLATEASSTPAVLRVTPFDISTRTLGMARASWAGVDIGSGPQRSPSVTALVQERVDDPTWVPGSAILFVLDQLTSVAFEIRQVDHGSASAPRLHLTFMNPATNP